MQVEDPIQNVIRDETEPTALSRPSAGRIDVGVSSWSDRSLTHESNWYPRRTMKAADRMAFYAEHFSLVEIEATYRFPPTLDLAMQWRDRTPEGFAIDIDCWSLLTGQPTMPASLWEDLMTEVRPDRRDRPKLYATHLSEAALEECWQRFAHAISPLVESGRLGTVILRYPRWFSPREESRVELERVRQRLGDLPAAVEFGCPEWVTAESCESTFGFLEDLDFSFVCVDAADDDPRGLGGSAATTNDLGVIRLTGRRSDQTDGWRPDARSYRYTDEELDVVSRRIVHLSEGAARVHVLVSTCWQDDAVRNAEALQQRLETPKPTINLRSAG